MKVKPEEPGLQDVETNSGLGRALNSIFKATTNTRIFYREKV